MAAPLITSPSMANVGENTTSVLTVTATDEDPGDTLTYSITGGADAALFSIDATSGALVFLTAPNFESPTDAGGDNVYDVQVSVSDGTSSDVQDIAVTVQDVNEAPNGATTSFIIPENATAAYGAGATASDPDGDPLTIVAVIDALGNRTELGTDPVTFSSGAIYGRLSDVEFTYAPSGVANIIDGFDSLASGETGTDLFFLVFSDGEFETQTRVNVTINGENDAPYLWIYNEVITDEDTPSSAVTIGAVDAEGDTLSYSVDPLNEPAKGTVTFSGDTFVYTPDADEVGGDEFTIEVSDGNGGVSRQIVFVDINPVQDAPEGADNTVTLDEDTTYTFAAADFGFTDVDLGDELVSVRIDTLALDADATLQLDGVDVTAGQVIVADDIDNLVFTPGADENGAAYSSFTFSVFDGADFDPTPATMTIDVTAVNDDPVLDGPSTSTTDEDTDLVFSTANGNALSISDVDVGGGTVSVRAYVVGGIAGTLSLGSTSGLTLSVGDGTDDPAQYFTGSLADVNAALDGLTFTPDEDFNGTATLNIAIRDDGNTGTGGGTTIDNLIEVTVNAVNDAPTIDLDISNTVVWDQYAFNPGDNFNISDFVSAENFSLADDTILTTFNVYLADRSGTNDGTFSNFNGTLSWAIYTNDGSPTPAVFITTGDDTDPDVTFTGIVSGTSRDIFAAEIDLGAVSLAAGDYWIALHEGAWQSPSDGTPIAWMQAASDGNAISRAFSDNEENPDSNWSSTLDPAAFSLGSQAITATEQVPLDLKGIIAVGDVDSGAGDITVTIGVDFGVLDVAPGTSGAEVTGSGTGAVTLTGTLAEIQALLGSGGDSVVTYTANSDTPPASASLSITVDDNGNTGSGGAMQASAGATILIEATNDAPEADNDSFETLEDTRLIVSSPGVLANDEDVEGDTLTAVLVRDVRNGTLDLRSDGSFTYTPNADFNGTDSFTYRAGDGDLESNLATVVITVGAVNDAPDLVDTFEITTTEDTPTGLVYINASDSDGDALIYGVNVAPENGTVALSGDSYVYTPDKDFNGVDTFVIRASDELGGISDQLVSVTVYSVNDAPVAADDSFSGVPDETTVIAIADILANDSDVDGDILSISNVLAQNGGSVTIDEDTVVFTPTPGFAGVAAFTYTVTDGKGGSDEGTVQVFLDDTVVEPENAVPVIVEPVIYLTTFDETAITYTVVATDDDGDPLAYSVAGAAGGTVSIGEDGVLLYVPGEDFTGEDSFTVTVDDGNGGSATQEVTVLVTQPDFDSQYYLVTEDGFSGAVGGSGSVFGTAGFQSITVIDRPGTVVFDPSFNAGGDIVTLDGDAADWFVARQGSSALLSDGDTFVVLPAGPAGMAVAFADGVRTLEISDGALVLGTQVLDATLTQVTSPVSSDPLPVDSGAPGRADLLLFAGADVSAGGDVDVFGTNDAETVSLLYGDVTLDPSFNRGDDTLVLPFDPEVFTATQMGSSVELDTLELDVLIPFGTAGMDIVFDGETRVLVFEDSALLIGTQAIDSGGTILIA